jgi:hypothetical protein
MMRLPQLPDHGLELVGREPPGAELDGRSGSRADVLPQHRRRQTLPGVDRLLGRGRAALQAPSVFGQGLGETSARQVPVA